MQQTNQRPRFSRKNDALMHGRTTMEDVAVDHAIAPFDRVGREMDQKWGVDVLPSLVSPELAAKYGRTLGALNDAIDAKDVERAIDRSSACIRGMAALEAEALSLGHTPADPGVVLVAMGDGHVFGILTEDRLWERAQEQHPGVKLYGPRELALLIQAAEKDPRIDAAKQIPGAKIVAIRDTKNHGSKGNLDDEIVW